MTDTDSTDAMIERLLKPLRDCYERTTRSDGYGPVIAADDMLEARGMVWENLRTALSYDGDALDPVEDKLSKLNMHPHNKRHLTQALSESRRRLAVIEESLQIVRAVAAVQLDIIDTGKADRAALIESLEGLAAAFKRQSAYEVGSGKYGSGHSAAMTFSEEKLSAILKDK